MIVSTAIAVLPMARSPMISSRWPRPIGIIESIALMPVWSGSFTGCRLMIPGATMSTLRVFVPWSGPNPSTGRPSASTTRPTPPAHPPPPQRRPHGHLQHAPGAAHLVPLPQHEVVAEDHGTDVVLFQVQRLPRDLLSRLRGGELEHLAGHGRGEMLEFTSS